MAQALALRLARPFPDAVDSLRGALVIGCALALILAGPFLPSLQ
ncbi:MAG: hypothetical protein ACKOOL_08865 [Novosphingobium sp.]